MVGLKPFDRQTTYRDRRINQDSVIGNPVGTRLHFGARTDKVKNAFLAEDAFLKIFTRGRLTAAVTCSLLTAFVGLSTAHAVDLQPHQAHYRLDIKELRMPGAVGGTPGQFIVRLQKRCTDWVLLTQLSMGLQMETGDVLEIASTGAAEESLDGRTMSFQSELRMNDELIEVLQGAAIRGEDGSGTVNITEPSVSTISLPKGTQFPVSAFQSTVARLLAGEKIVDYVLFDGSTPEPIRGSDLVLGAARPLDTPPDGDNNLIDGQSWKIVTSFYAMEATDSQPLVSNTADVYINGITTRLSLDIGLAVTDGTLTLLQELPQPKC